MPITTDHLGLVKPEAADDLISGAGAAGGLVETMSDNLDLIDAAPGVLVLDSIDDAPSPTGNNLGVMAYAKDTKTYWVASGGLWYRRFPKGLLGRATRTTNTFNASPIWMSFVSVNVEVPPNSNYLIGLYNVAETGIEVTATIPYLYSGSRENYAWFMRDGIILRDNLHWQPAGGYSSGMSMTVVDYPPPGWHTYSWGIFCYSTVAINPAAYGSKFAMTISVAEV